MINYAYTDDELDALEECIRHLRKAATRRREAIERANCAVGWEASHAASRDVADATQHVLHWVTHAADIMTFGRTYYWCTYDRIDDAEKFVNPKRVKVNHEEHR